MFFFVENETMNRDKKALSQHPQLYKRSPQMTTVQKRLLTSVDVIGLITTCAGLCGCTDVRYQPYAPRSNAPMFGTPVRTRMSAEEKSFRFLGLGSAPSQKSAVDKLYSYAGYAGFRINNNNYAFQNISTEEERALLYPIFGTCTITVTADLYAYENPPYGSEEKQPSEQTSYSEDSLTEGHTYEDQFDSEYPQNIKFHR